MRRGETAQDGEILTGAETIAQALRLFAKRTRQEAEQGAPALERLAHLMHDLGLAQLGIGESPAGIGNNRTRGGCQTVPEAVVLSRSIAFFAAVSWQVHEFQAFPLFPWSPAVAT